MNEMMFRKKIKTVIQGLRDNIPYPEDVFIEPTKKQYQKLHSYLQNNGLSDDKFFGAFGRCVWNNCLDKIEEELDLNY